MTLSAVDQSHSGSDIQSKPRIQGRFTDYDDVMQYFHIDVDPSNRCERPGSKIVVGAFSKLKRSFAGFVLVV